MKELSKRLLVERTNNPFFDLLGRKCVKNGTKTLPFNSSSYLGALHFKELGDHRLSTRDPENLLIELLRKEINNWYITKPDGSLYYTPFGCIDISNSGFKFINWMYPSHLTDSNIHSSKKLNVFVNCEGIIDAKNDIGLYNVKLNSHFDAKIPEDRKLSVEDLIGYENGTLKIDSHKLTYKDFPVALFETKEGCREFTLKGKNNGRILSYSGYVDDNNNIVGKLKVEVYRNLPERTIKDRKALEFNNEVLWSLVYEERMFAESVAYYTKSIELLELDNGDVAALQDDNKFEIFDNNKTPKMLVEKNDGEKWKFTVFGGDKVDTLYGIGKTEGEPFTQIIGRVNNMLVYLDVKDDKKIEELSEKICSAVDKCREREILPKQTVEAKVKRILSTKKLTQVRRME